MLYIYLYSLQFGSKYMPEHVKDVKGVVIIKHRIAQNGREWYWTVKSGKMQLNLMQLLPAGAGLQESW